MTKLIWASVPVLAVVAVLGGLSHSNEERRLKVVGGQSSITFFPSILESNGIRVRTQDAASQGSGSGESAIDFEFSKPDLGFTLKEGQLGHFEKGSLRHKGGFELVASTGSVNIHQFSITPNASVTDGLQLSADSGKETFVVFDLAHPRTLFSRSTMNLAVADMDMLVSLTCAQRLGKPELAGKLVGTMSIAMDSETVDGNGLSELPPPPSPPKLEGPIDVALSSMGSLTSLGRTGTYPNGRNGLSMSTTSCNVGTQNIPWSAPMNVQHPSIAMNLYRITNGRFEQIGWSWMKHGFFATNSTGCGSCTPSGTGALLGVGCSDTYGTGNNGDRNYLGGRDEINPFTGVWTCTGSYFSNYVADCVRRNNGSGLDAVAHRLEVRDADMGNANSQYYYEAYYINANETNKYNNIASRQASMTWSGSAWNISTIDSQQIQGPAINRWGDMRATATPQTEGDVIVGVKVTDLGNGMWHYEYALYNHDLDRQVREFSVPLPDNATVQNIEFRDIDQDSTNQWSSEFANNKISWATGVFGSSTANPLKFSSVFNFRFDCNIPPSSGSVKLGLFKPGTGTELSAAVKAPLFLNGPSGFVVENGSQLSGSLQSLIASDDDRMKLAPSSEGSRSGTSLRGSFTAPQGTISVLTIGVEASNTLSGGVGATQTIHLWNWSTSAWELIDTRATTASDSKAVVGVNSNVSRFIDPQSNEIRVKVTHSSNSGPFSNRWSFELDQVGIQFG